MRNWHKFFNAIAVATVCLSGAVSAADVKVGATAPDFALPAIAGSNLRLSEYRSEVVLLTFWSPWCSDCTNALPVLNTLQKQHQRAGLQILGIDVKGNEKELRQAAEKYSLAFPQLMDAEQTISRMYKLHDLPTSVLIDRYGKVLSVYRGLETSTVKRLQTDLAQALED